MRVAFFQRLFANYQTGLVSELAGSTVHAYRFYGGVKDPDNSGLCPIQDTLREQIPFVVCKSSCLGKFVFQWRAVLSSLFEEMDVIILEGNFAIVTNWIVILIAKVRRKRVLLYTHGWLKHEVGIKTCVRNIFYKFSDGLLVYGRRAREIGLEYGFPSKRLYVTLNSLDYSTISACRAHISELSCNKLKAQMFGSNADKPLIVSVGRLSPVKQYPLLLEAVDILKRKGISINVLLVGEGAERERLERKAEKTGVRLVCAGAQYDEPFLGVCFVSADMTVIPGAAGLTVVHSLSYGTPVVLHNNMDHQMPEAEAVIPKFNGAFFPEGNSFALAGVIQEVLQTLPRGPRVAKQCVESVESGYLPSKMRVVFDRAVSGYPAEGV